MRENVNNVWSHLFIYMKFKNRQDLFFFSRGFVSQEVLLGKVTGNPWHNTNAPP